MSTDRYGFPLRRCSRCGGCGRYSFNLRDLDRCYGCGGTGWMIAIGAAKAHGEFLAARKATFEAVIGPIGGTYGVLAIGDEVRTAAGEEARTIAAITVADEVCGWSGTERTPCAWKAAITFTDGTVAATTTNQVWRRKGTVDPAPFVARALRGVEYMATRPERNTR